MCCTQRLSQNATSPASQRHRTVNDSCVEWRNSKSSNGLASCAAQPSRPTVYCAFTNSTSRPVSAWTRIAGCGCMRSASELVFTVMPTNMSCTPCIFGEYALIALCTPSSTRSVARKPRDNVRVARYWFAQIVSDP